MFALIAVQLIVFIMGLWLLSNRFFYFYAVCVILSIIVVVWLVSKRDNPSYKLAWSIPITLFPLFGGLFYLLFGNKRIPRAMKEGLARTYEETLPYLPPNNEELVALHKCNPAAYRQALYFNTFALAPTYDDTWTDFQTPGEAHFPRLIEELKKAKRYIFMEYFIVQHGYMLDTILEVLEERLAAGVDVRILYDDVGSAFTVDRKFIPKIKQRGIQIARFNPLVARPAAILNNRDHRKITVVDGIVGFTGGVNLADEYINKVRKFGYWKDSALMLKGGAVWSMTVMFLQTWNLIHNIYDEDYRKYYPNEQCYLADGEKVGYVTPFGDSPLDDETVGENAYLNVINKANRYLFIETPYFIVDNEMMTSLELAAKQGVDIRVIVPHIPDKRLVFTVTQAYYPQLIEAGVRVYEYTPGFIHTKALVADDEYAVVGTVNFDYRSFYLHFECGVWMYKTRAVEQVRDDFLDTLRQCQEITFEDIEKTRTPKRSVQGLLRLFAPLM